MDITRRTAAGLLAGTPALSLGPDAGSAASAADRMRRYNVVWHTPSRNASGVMPVGNGDIAAGVYAIEGGDLYLLLSKNDALTYMGDIFKTGRVRVSLDPNPFRPGQPFRQTLDLGNGSIVIEAGGVTLRIWADANRPVCHVEIESPHEVSVTARPDLWKRFDNCVYNYTGTYGKGVLPASGTEPVQDVTLERRNHLLWYYAVGDRSVFQDDLRYYQVEALASKFQDPLRHNNFGNLLESPGMKVERGALHGSGRRFDIRIHALAMQSADPGVFIRALERSAARPVDLRADWDRHQAWWSRFWERSWIVASDRTVPAAAREKFSGEASPAGRREEQDGAALVAQSYNVFRFLMACQSRGRIQVKFNGGLFTQQLLVQDSDKQKRTGAKRQVEGGWLLHEDDRLWGRRFTYQNQRLLYWPLLASGDFDLMKPFFAYYSDMLPVRKAITQAWFGHGGAYYRENVEPTGAERDCGEDGRPPKRAPGQAATFYHDYYFTCGLETVAMMAAYVNHTSDAAFRDRVLVPFAREILLFYHLHYPRGADGKLRLDPSQVLETWWLSVNPATDLAGLRFCLDELLAMNAGSVDDRSFWRKLRAEVPPVPLRSIEGRQAIAPAEQWSQRHNSENGELYPVFPFPCFGVALGSADVVEWTMRHRSLKDAFGASCWTQDQIHWAFAGRAWEAAQGLVRRFRTASTMCRFPLYGREGPDSCPDFDHFGAGSVALQRMIVQEAGRKILLLPAWPDTWDADFKLHLTHGAVLTGTVKEGKLVAWDVQPASRRQDVVIRQPQAAPPPGQG